MDQFQLVYILDIQTLFLVSQSVNMNYENSFYKSHISMLIVFKQSNCSSYKHNMDNSIALKLDFNIMQVESILILVLTLSIITLLEFLNLNQFLYQ